MKKLSARRVVEFQSIVWRHYRAHGRNLAWRRTHDPYRILVSEFMLQQTQVGRVIPTYRAFLKKFPNFTGLHRAPLFDVLAAWQGLGYNRRVLLLKKLAARVMADYQGKLPADPKLLDELPGIGKGTAGAICAFAFQIPAPFIETNIRRVYLHFFFPKQSRVPDADVLDLVAQTLDAKNPREWYYALMDYGAVLGREEKENPNRRSRHYAKQSRFEGSDRQIRGKIIRLLVEHRAISRAQLKKLVNIPQERLDVIVKTLAKDGFVAHRGVRITLASDTDFQSLTPKL